MNNNQTCPSIVHMKHVLERTCDTCIVSHVYLFRGIIRNYKLLVQCCGQFLCMVCSVGNSHCTCFHFVCFFFSFCVCVWSISHLVLMLRTSGAIPLLQIYFHGMLSDFNCTTLRYFSFLPSFASGRNINDPSAHVKFTCTFNIFIFYLFVWCSESFTGPVC